MNTEQLDIPQRTGRKPRTKPTMPHEQLSDTAPVVLQEALFERARTLPGVMVGRSRVSVPGAKAFALDEDHAKGPQEAFMAGREFAHLHPPHDGSLHLTLPPDLARDVVNAGWGEFHPAVDMGFMPPTGIMVFGPRDEAELEVVWQILQASYRFAQSGE